MSDASACEHEFDEGHREGDRYVLKCQRCGLRSEIPLKEVRSPAVTVELPAEEHSEENSGQ